MKQPRPIKPGQPITADFLNRLRREESLHGWGSGQTNSANLYPPGVQLFKAQENFASHEDVYRGDCKLWWRDKPNNEYAVHGDAIKVYSQIDGVTSGDVVPAFFNVQSGRWEAIFYDTDGGATTPGGGSGSTPCCTDCYETGSVSRASYEWADRYLITFSDASFPDTYVVDQGTYWESAVTSVTCTNGTDFYKVRMEASGVTSGSVVITIFMTFGGGSGGDSACCDSVAAGFTAKWVNCCIVDPLCGFTATRDPSGFTGRFCAPQDCSVCVIPTPNTVPATCECDTSDIVNIDAPELYLFNLYGFAGVGTITSPSRTLNLVNCNGSFLSGSGLSNTSLIDECTDPVVDWTTCRRWSYTGGGGANTLSNVNVRLLHYTGCQYKLLTIVELYDDNVGSPQNTTVCRFVTDPYTPVDEDDLSAWLLEPKTITSACQTLVTGGTIGDLRLEPGV